jgi:hypothetical protein
MDQDEIVNRFIEAWNQKDVSNLLGLMHPQASFYDAFWQESCSGRYLAEYLSTSFEYEGYRYRLADEIIRIPNGFIARYEALHRDDDLGLVPVFKGTDILTVVDGMIMTVSDYYCDPTPTALIEVSMLAEGQHGRANVIERGLGTSTANGSRARHATTIMIEAANGDVRFDVISEQCGFESIKELNDAFQKTFDLTADEYMEKFAQQ